MTTKEAQKIADRLNGLLAAAKPYEICSHGWPDRSTVTSPLTRAQDSQVKRRVLQAFEDEEPRAMAREIAAAAREKRPADLQTAGGYQTCFRLDHDIWEAIRGEVAAIIATENARSLAEYEQYRLACEQGVAVAPATA